MSNPDRGLIPLSISLNRADETRPEITAFNPFQLRMFLYFHQYYDKFISLNGFRTKIYGPQEARVENAKQAVIRAVDTNQSLAVAPKIAELLAFSLGGLEDSQPFTELYTRALLDIDKPSYQAILKYFEKYTRGLRIFDESQEIFPSDPRLFSNTAEFRTLLSNLAGFYLLSIGFPNAQMYSEANWQAFLRSIKERIEKTTKTINSELTHR